MPTALRAHAGRPDLATLPRLGIGMLFNAALPPVLPDLLDVVDFIEVIPETFWEDSGTHALPRYLERPPLVATLDSLAKRCPLTCHNSSLSIGGVGLFDEQYLEQIAAWHARYEFAWHSGSLSVSRMNVADDEDDANASLARLDHEELLDVIVTRVFTVRRTIPATFLLENGIGLLGPEMELPQLLNQVCARAGCGLLLDICQVYRNAVGNDLDPVALIDALELAHVIEVHVTGGEESPSVNTDACSGAVPEPMWDLLAHVASRAPNLRAVTFEFHESVYDRLCADGIIDQLDRARAIWTPRPAVLS